MRAKFYQATTPKSQFFSYKPTREILLLPPTIPKVKPLARVGRMSEGKQLKWGLFYPFHCKEFWFDLNEKKGNLFANNMENSRFTNTHAVW